MFQKTRVVTCEVSTSRKQEFSTINLRFLHWAINECIELKEKEGDSPQL